MAYRDDFNDGGFQGYEDEWPYGPLTWGERVAVWFAALCIVVGVIAVLGAIMLQGSPHVLGQLWRDAVHYFGG